MKESMNVFISKLIDIKSHSYIICSYDILFRNSTLVLECLNGSVCLCSHDMEGQGRFAWTRL